MTRIGSFVTIAALGLAAPVAAQGSRSADATASVVITPSLSLAKVQDLNFGSHFASDGVIETDNVNFVRWSGQTDPGVQMAISFQFSALPAQLNRVGGGDFVPISYGTTSASVGEGSSQSQFFNPATGVAAQGAFTGDGSFAVFLGLPGGNGPSDLVSVDLTGKPAGTYQATITLTVTVQ